MTTDLITVHPDEPMDLVIRLMDWRHIRHVPVEDEDGKVAGLLSCFEALRQWAPAAPDADGEPVPVRTVMQPDPVTIAPEATVTEAVARMREARSDYLLVVKEERLVGDRDRERHPPAYGAPAGAARRRGRRRWAADPPGAGHVFPRLLGSYGGDAAGPLVIGIGGMHGNEPAGALALPAGAGRALGAAEAPFRGLLRRACRQPPPPSPAAAATSTRTSIAGGRANASCGSGAAARPRTRPPRNSSSATCWRAWTPSWRGAGGPVVCLDLHTTSAAGHPVRGHRRHPAESPVRLPPPRPGGSRPGRVPGEHHPEPPGRGRARGRRFRGGAA